MTKHVLAAAILAASAPSYATVYGFLGNFDVVNDTGKTAHGFEIELEGLHASDITDTFGGAGRGFPSTVERYGAPTIVEYSNGTTFGVRITYQATFANGAWNVGTPSGTVPTPSDSCWTGGTPLYGPSYPCDHFGVGHTGTQTKTTYYWLTETTPDSSALAPVEAVLPAPTWTVTPQPAPAPNVAPPPPIVQVQVVAPEPNQYEFGEAKWVKVYTTELDGPVALEELVGDNAKIRQAEQHTEIEWQLLQVDFKKPGSGQIDLGGQAGANAQSVVRRFEFYEYTGTYNAETHEALAVNGDSATPAAGDLGKFLGAQNDGVNLLGVYVAPAAVPPTLDTASLADGTVGVAYSQTVSATPGNAGDALTIAVTNLPAGLSFNGTSIVGTPSALGTTPVNVTVTDTVNNLSTSATLNLTVVDAPLAFTLTPPDATVNLPYSFTLAAMGGQGGFTYSSANLPDGLSIVNDTITGTPTTAGSYSVTITATDALGTSIDATATLNVSLQSCSGTNEIVSSVDPSWLNIGGGMGNGGKSVIYAPDANTAFDPLLIDPVSQTGTFQVGQIVSYTGTVSGDFCAADTMWVAPGLGLDPITLPAGQVGTAYPSVAVNPTGGVAPYSVVVSGLPAGLSFDGAAISGTPASGTAGSYTVVVQVTDDIGETVSSNPSLTINPAPASPSCTKPAGATGGLNSKGTITAISGNVVTFRKSSGVLVSVTVPACATIQWNGGAHAFAVGQVFEWNGYYSAATGNVAQSVTIN